MICGIAMGSNLGERLENLQLAARELQRACGPLRTSPVYETTPVDCPEGSPAFLNGVCEVHWTGAVEALHALTRGIEAMLGRRADRAVNAPRPIDLDLLYCGDLQVRTEDLEIPHPRLSQRRFVLEPLSCIRPDLILPGFDRTVARLLADLPSTEPPLHLFSKDWFMPHSAAEKLSHFAAIKPGGRKITSLTAADYPTARLLDEAGIDLILVGDSLGMVVLGYPDTTLVTMEEMLHHTRTVRRGVQCALLAADLPYHSYQTPAQAVENARRLVNAGAEAVKLEGGRSMLPQIKAILAAGIAVIGHIGMLPQSVREEGGYRKKGKSSEEAEGLLADAAALDAAGVCSLVLEGVIPTVSARITAAVRCPTIGIGSGKECDGQILVTHDLIGAFPWFRPPFATARGNVAGVIRDALHAFIADVGNR
ncbi:MAG: 3-methyl-2-oxobutanoate hydroxymethyltransferase [Verrucomicrobiales bacterium]|nr:3-methyl-2-oxobutanoate hydroxymethyltransferase [Verrucomicrobiales bacterium]